MYTRNTVFLNGKAYDLFLTMSFIDQVYGVDGMTREQFDEVNDTLQFLKYKPEYDKWDIIRDPGQGDNMFTCLDWFFRDWGIECHIIEIDGPFEEAITEESVRVGPNYNELATELLEADLIDPNEPMIDVGMEFEDMEPLNWEEIEAEYNL